MLHLLAMQNHTYAEASVPQARGLTANHFKIFLEFNSPILTYLRSTRTRSKVTPQRHMRSAPPPVQIFEFT